VKRALLLGAALAAALSASARPAEAYVRYKSACGKPFQWGQSCIFMTAYPADLQAMMTVDEILADTDAAAATWSNVSDACTYLQIMVSSSMDKTPHAANDGRNNILYRSHDWCKQTATGGCDANVSYDPAALALTSVSASTSTGLIKDADLEVNAFNFRWADLVVHPDLIGDGQSVHDLQNALTHEMGHVIGLDHTCYLQPPPLIDNNGNPTPDCADAMPDVLATTMFPSANPGDTDKRTLAPDDQQAVCEIYPAASDPQNCAPPMSSTLQGCSACAAGGAPAPGAASALALAAVALLAVRARRRRPRRNRVQSRS
jgi:MYXO-CTERM domain-containing protein